MNIQMTERPIASLKSLFQTKFFNLFLILVFCSIQSLSCVFVKLSERELSPVATIFDRFVIATIIFGVGIGMEVANRKKNDEDSTQSSLYSLKVIVLLIVAGLSAAANQVFWALSLTQTNIGNSSLMHGLTPLFSILLTWLFFQYRYDRQFIVGTVIAIIASAAIGFGDFQVAATKLQGDGLGLLAAMFFAVYLVLVEQLRACLNTVNILFWRCILGILLLLPIILSSGDRLLPDSQGGWLAIIGVVLVFPLAHALLAYSLKTISSSLVAVVLLAEPFLSSLQAWLILSENLSILEGILFTITIFGVYLSISSPSAKMSE
ncbi:MAG: DMT family transporter [Cyanobacteria bacterium P01_E01_bin.42]